MNKKSNWILTVFILTFILSVVFSTISSSMAMSCNNIVLMIVLLIVIAIGIIFDIIGTACITANESTFHALSSKKKTGAKEALMLIKNKNKLSSICNDIIGDGCGVISGSMGTFLAISISTLTGYNNTVVSVVLAAFISSATVGGKAIFKVVAMANADSIVYNVGKFIHIFKIGK